MYVNFKKAQFYVCEYMNNYGHKIQLFTTMCVFFRNGKSVISSPKSESNI